MARSWAPRGLNEVFRLHAQGRTRVVREVRQLDEVNECFEDVEKSQVQARLVFDLRCVFAVAAMTAEA